MTHQFDGLARSMAQTVTRQQAFGQFGLDVAYTARASFGLANQAEASETKTAKY